MAAEVLSALGVNFAAVQLDVKQWTRSLTVTPAEIPPKLPFTPRTLRIFELAIEYASLLHQGHRKMWVETPLFSDSGGRLYIKVCAMLG